MLVLEILSDRERGSMSYHIRDLKLLEGDLFKDYKRQVILFHL